MADVAIPYESSSEAMVMPQSVWSYLWEIMTFQKVRNQFVSVYVNIGRLSIGPVINTFVKEALRGNFQRGKVILEMAGLYNEKASVDC